MDLKSQLRNSLQEAMRAGDTTRKNTLRMALTAIQLAEVEKGQSLDESGLMGILQKEVKSRRESIADAERAGRSDLVAAAENEIAVLEAFLPKAFSNEELEVLVKQAIQETGATSMREMGQVMKVLMPHLQGRATGDQASQAVRRALQ
ncbi:MAG: GatB/YqeY domain-containing protein [Anaerolineales bacterium]|nr:GatB/YqeY domain-containing protein [Anaerolineales bacterium]